MLGSNTWRAWATAPTSGGRRGGRDLTISVMCCKERASACPCRPRARRRVGNLIQEYGAYDIITLSAAGLPVELVVAQTTSALVTSGTVVVAVVLCGYHQDERMGGHICVNNGATLAR